MWTCTSCYTVNEGTVCRGCGRPGPAGAYRRMLTRPEIKERAKQCLSGQRSNAILSFFLPGLIVAGAIMLVNLIFGGASLIGVLTDAVLYDSSPEEMLFGLASALGVSAIGSLLITGINLVVPLVLTCGQSYNAIRLYRRENTEVKNLFRGFQGNFTHIWGGMLWQTLFLFLWALIPVVGPVFATIKGYAYYMTPYLLIERPEIDARDALKKSIQMTEGHKMDLFVLDLSFIGWGMLSALTLGILGIIFVGPYAGISRAGYYDELEAAYFGGPAVRVADIPGPRPGPEYRPGYRPEYSPPPARPERPAFSGATWTCPICRQVNADLFCANCGVRRPEAAPADPFAARPADGFGHHGAPPPAGGAPSGRLKINMGKRRSEPPEKPDQYMRPPKGF